MAAEAAEIVADTEAAMRTVVAGIDYPSIALANTVAGPVVGSPVVAAVDSCVVAAGLGTLVDAGTVHSYAELEAPSPWPCPLQKACQMLTWFTLDVVECEGV